MKNAHDALSAVLSGEAKPTWTGHTFGCHDGKRFRACQEAIDAARADSGRDAEGLTDARIVDAFMSCLECACGVRLDGEEVGAPTKGTTLEVGQRVVTLRDIERFPHFYIRAGATGTVLNTVGTLIVKMDDLVEGAEEWDNEVHWYFDQNLYEDDAVLDLAAITEEVTR